MRDDDLGPGAAADLEGLVHRLQDVVALVAHVGGIDAAPFAERFGDLGHLVGRGGVGDGIEKPARHADGALFQALVEQIAHYLDLGGRGGADQIVAHGIHAQRAVPDQESAVDGRRGRVDLAGELGKAFRHVLLLLHDQRQEVADVGAQIGRGRHAAVAANDGRHPLAGLHRHGRIVDQSSVVVRVHVDEARRHDLADGVDLVVAAQCAWRLDGGDAVAFQRHIGRKQLLARPVGHLAVTDHGVVGRHGCTL